LALLWDLPQSRGAIAVRAGDEAGAKKKDKEETS